MCECVAGLCHDGADVGKSVGSSASCLAETVGGCLGAAEDCGIYLRLRVGACSWNDGSLDAEGGGVSSCIAGLWVRSIYVEV